MIRDEALLQSARSGKKKKGQAFLIKYLEGGKLVRSQAVYAKCYDCNGMGDSDECDIEGCPLYPFSQFFSGKHAGSAPGTKKRIVEGGAA